MKLYLSSYKFGDHVDQLKEMIGNPKTAYINNALDCYPDIQARQESDEKNLGELRAIGLEPSTVDLRDYFGKKDALETELSQYGCLWVRGGNTFVLRKAMQLSGFDQLIHQLVARKDLVYAGYSAGIVLLGDTLRGLDLVDEPHVIPYEDQSTIWEGLGILHYTIIPHYLSDHPEAADVKKTLQYCIEHKIPFKALRDGEVIIGEI